VLPLNDNEHWPDLADAAQPLTDGAFEMQTPCHVVPDTTLTEGMQSARARIDHAADAWSVAAADRPLCGRSVAAEPTGVGTVQLLVDTVLNCESRVAGADVGVTTAESDCGHADVHSSPPRLTFPAIRSSRTSICRR
jgi:hypothetical protein